MGEPDREELIRHRQRNTKRREDLEDQSPKKRGAICLKLYTPHTLRSTEQQNQPTKKRLTIYSARLYKITVDRVYRRHLLAHGVAVHHNCNDCSFDTTAMYIQACRMEVTAHFARICFHYDSYAYL